MKKAERIFQNTRYATMKYIEAWGYNNEVDGGWSGGWITETDETPEGELIYQRTFNELKKLLESRARHLAACERHNLMTPEQLELEVKVFQMMCKTAHNTYISGKRIP